MESINSNQSNSVKKMAGLVHWVVTGYLESFRRSAWQHLLRLGVSG